MPYGNKDTLTANQAQNFVEEIMHDTKHPVWDATHPMHRQDLEKRTEAYRVLAREKPGWRVQDDVAGGIDTDRIRAEHQQKLLDQFPIREGREGE